MNIPHSFPHQYRTFEHTYLFKIKPHQGISLKIFDLSKKCLFKGKLPYQEMPLNASQLLTNKRFTLILNSFKDLPEEYLPEGANDKTYQTILNEEIKILESKTKKRKAPKKEASNVMTCPITFEPFKEPMTTNCGHIFEKEAIQKHLATKEECPQCRKSVHNLTRIYLSQEDPEVRADQSSVPNFSLFQKQNPRLAQLHLETARAHTEEKEYKEALKTYTKAFRYTKNPADYASLPSLFEKTGESEKATLAYLYLTQYHLQAGNVQGAIQSLQSSRKEADIPFEHVLILIELYKLNGEQQKALEFSTETAKALSRRNPERAINIYKHVLRGLSFNHALYVALIKLIDNPRENAHVLLKGALEAIKAKDYKAAEAFAEQGKNLLGESFIDALVSLEVSLKQEKTAEAKLKLHNLAKFFEIKSLTDQALGVYKMLFQLDQYPEHAAKILTAYHSLQKPKKELKWSLITLSQQVRAKSWEGAEKTAKQALEKAQTSEERLPFYEKLEEIYTHWHTDKLEALWPKLGKAQQDSQQLAKAEITLKKAAQHSPSFETCLALATVLKDLKKVKESVSAYHETALAALIEDDLEKLSQCIQEIKEIDPTLKHLSSRQKADLLSQEKILRLSKELEAAKVAASVKTAPPPAKPTTVEATEVPMAVRKTACQEQMEREAALAIRAAEEEQARIAAAQAVRDQEEATRPAPARTKTAHERHKDIQTDVYFRTEEEFRRSADKFGLGIALAAAEGRRYEMSFEDLDLGGIYNPFTDFSGL